VKLEAKAAGAQGTTAASGSRTVFSLSEDETMDLGRGLGRALKGGELLLLEGDLGYGKTVFARGVATALGILPDEVTSPSFTLVQSTGWTSPCSTSTCTGSRPPRTIGALTERSLAAEASLVEG
jgi:hypothetical protein